MVQKQGESAKTGPHLAPTIADFVPTMTHLAPTMTARVPVTTHFVSVTTHLAPTIADFVPVRASLFRAKTPIATGKRTVCVENRSVPRREPRGSKTMHICGHLRTTQKPRSVLNFFPPKDDAAAEELYKNISELEALHPTFVSVTYGAGGSTRQRTHDLVVRLKEQTTLEPIPHLTCVCHGKDEIQDILQRYAQAGISNVLALGGDPPRSLESHDRNADAFRYASDLVAYVKAFPHPDAKGFWRRRRRLPRRPPRNPEPPARNGLF